MNPMAFLRRSPNRALSIAKILSLLIVAVAAAVAAARSAAPYLAGVLSSVVSRLRLWLVPPYLFIAVHLIILTIWKLSDQKLHKNPNEKPSSSDSFKPRGSVMTPSKAISGEIPVESDAVTPVSRSRSAESCVTTESDENSAVSVSSRFEIKNEEDEDLGLEDTWQSIVLEKRDTWERSHQLSAAEISGDGRMRKSVAFKDSSQPPPPPATVAEGNEDWNRKFEAFIKKNYDQIRSY